MPISDLNGSSIPKYSSSFNNSKTTLVKFKTKKHIWAHGFVTGHKYHIHWGDYGKIVNKFSIESFLFGHK